MVVFVRAALAVATVASLLSGCADVTAPTASAMYTQQQLNTIARQPGPTPLAPPPGYTSRTN